MLDGCTVMEIRPLADFNGPSTGFSLTGSGQERGPKYLESRALDASAPEA
jgi:hypothetical protein